MARNKRRSSEYAVTPVARSLSMPGVFLVRMLIFLVLVGFIVAILAPQFITAFQANPGLNGLIRCRACNVAHSVNERICGLGVCV